VKAKAQQLLIILQSDPWQNPQPYGELVGDLSVAYSRRINIQHWLVYKRFRGVKSGQEITAVGSTRVVDYLSF